MARSLTRREVLKTSALAGAGYFIAHDIARADKSPNEKIRFAAIGVGGKGGSDCDHAGELGDMVALCDADENTLNKKGEKFTTAKKYTDFRKMFDEIGKDIDAVVVSTPDHTHAPASMMAMRMGKHVYCQKPLTHSVFEARIMRETAAKMKVATQMGNQGTAENGLRTAVEMIQTGVIGPVREAHIWTNRPIWPQAPQIVARPEGEDAIPANLNWDAWIGPAPMRPYKNGLYHSFKWRGWWDFGTGALGDMGCHTANMTFMALKLGHPTSVEATAGDLNNETCPSFLTAKFEFPARGDMPPVKIFWYEGKVKSASGELVKNLPPAELLHGENPPGSGSLLVGDKGILYSANDYGASYKLLPTKEFVGYEPPKPWLARNGAGDKGMKAEWVAAIKGGPAPFSNFEYAGLLTEFILLGNVAARTGEKIAWDGPNCKVTNSSAAEQYIRREYRKGWTL